MISVQANAGEAGATYGHSFGDYNVEGRISLPIFTGGRIQSDIAAAEATFRQCNAELADIHERTIFDVRRADYGRRSKATRPHSNEFRVWLKRFPGDAWGASRRSRKLCCSLLQMTAALSRKPNCSPMGVWDRSNGWRDGSHARGDRGKLRVARYSGGTR